MTATPTTSPASQGELWAKAAAQIEALHERELAWAQQLKRDLTTHAGYFAAALARVAELKVQYQDRPNWAWAAERWEKLMREGGRAEVLLLLEDPVKHQELLSASPFAVMRPPLPENSFYATYAIQGAD
jgi:hypothetical protein